jgi:hypothetical protein
MLWTAEGHQPRRSHLSPLLLAALETGNTHAGDAATERERPRATLRFLAAAAMFDVAAIPESHIAPQLGYVVDETEVRGVERSRPARNAVEKGRQLWRRLGAWPWWCWQPDDGKRKRGRLPDGWQDNLEVREALEAWALPGTQARHAS